MGSNLLSLPSGGKETGIVELDPSRSDVDDAIQLGDRLFLLPPTSCVVGEHCVANMNDPTIDVEILIQLLKFHSERYQLNGSTS